MITELKRYKIKFTVFGNFSSHKIIDIADISDTKIIVWNLIKDETWDWPIHYEDLTIDKINEEKL